MWIGYDDVDRLITYPDVNNLSGCSQPIHMRSLIHPTWPILAVFTRRACGLATTPPQVTPLLPPIGGKCTTQGSAAPAGARRGTANWGNRTIRTTTRRRHAGRQLLMLPNPHAWGDGRTSELAAVPVGGDNTAASQISHIIYRGHFSRCPKNVAIPTTQMQCLNESSRNYVQSC